MKGLNRVTLIGTLGKDPETRYVSETNVVTKIVLATNRNWVDKQGQKVEETEWHNIEAWGKTAEILAQYLRKGSNLFIEGRIKTDSYDAKDGSGKRYSTKIIVENFGFLGGNNQTAQNGQNGQQAPYATPANGQPTCAPPTGQPAYAPPIGQPAYAPPTGQPAYAPPAGQPAYAPPAGQPAYAPPAGQPAYAPPAGQPAYAPPAGQPAYAPPAGQPAYAPQGGQQGVTQSSQDFSNNLDVVEDELPF